jgi:signal transduction histidine kinase
MLDSALNGNFTEKTYDESKLSYLESKLNRYLNISLSSEKNLAAEKDRIKTLISDISHQTKTPIANIVLYAQLLAEQKNLDKEAIVFVNEITSQSEKLNFLIQALIKTSRLEAGIIAVKTQNASIKELLTSVCSAINNKALEKEIQININCEDLYAEFDAKWTEEAIYNIVDNAVKYTPEHGTINISATNYELFARIDIKDTGIGIAEQDISSIFQRFYRSPQVSSYEGIGIGLFLARQIIASQRGYIKVSSTLGKGSTFSIFLPRD